MSVEKNCTKTQIDRALFFCWSYAVTRDDECKLKVEHDLPWGSDKVTIFLGMLNFSRIFNRRFFSLSRLCRVLSSKYWLKMRQVWLWYWNNSWANMARKFEYSILSLTSVRPWTMYEYIRFLAIDYYMRKIIAIFSIVHFVTIGVSLEIEMGAARCAKVWCTCFSLQFNITVQYFGWWLKWHGWWL